MLTVDDYERIRRLVLVDGLSQRAAARRLGHSRKTVRKALEHSCPPGYRRRAPAARPVIDPVREIIDTWIEQDRRRPRKQRHTGTRIYERLRDEYGFTGSVSAVRRYIARKKANSGEVFFPLQFAPGEEAQVDWGEARCVIGGVERKVQLFCMRLCHSTASFVRAYERQNQESLLDGHVRAFRFFGGVPRRCAYDNMKVAVISVGKGQDRRLTERFRRLRSHYLFRTRFCNVASAHEKGHVENLVRLTQRRFMTPVPEVASLAQLNEHLLGECERDQDRPARRHSGSRRELLKEETARMLPLPGADFPACREDSTFATKQSLVRFDSNDYSVPVRWAHHPVVVKGFVERVELYVQDRLVATHRRSCGAGEYILEPEHYIPLLESKPGGIHNARPFKGQPWGEGFARMRRELEYRYGSEGTGKFVDLLLLFTEFPAGVVKQAVRECVRRRAFSEEAVRATLTYRPRRKVGRLELAGRPELTALSERTRPAGVYDALLSGEEVGR
jgi:transposase